MKICFFAHSARNGGAERSLLETIEALRAEGVDCVVLAPTTGPFTESLAALGVPHRILPFKRWAAQEGGPLWRRVARTLSTLLLAPLAAIWIRRRRVDLVYTNTMTIGIGCLAAWLAGRPHVWHIRELGYEHGRLVFDLGRKASLALMRWGSRICLANSHCVAQHYRPSLAPTAVHVVYQCVKFDTARIAFEPPPFEGLRLAVVGALSPQKRQDEAISAVAGLRSAGREVRLLIVGEGSPAYETLLREQAEVLGLKAEVTFLGALESAAGVIRWAEILLNCSRYEAFGRVTVEGMLAGKTVIGARSGGTAEMIREGETGLLYEPGDVDGLLRQLLALADDPARISEIGRAAREWSQERFTPRRYAGELLRLLQPPGACSTPAPASASRNNPTSRADVSDSE